MEVLNATLKKFKRKKTLLVLTDEELASLPKAFLSRYAYYSISDVWARLDDKIKKDPNIAEYEICSNHPTLDKEPITKDECTHCQKHAPESSESGDSDDDDDDSDDDFYDEGEDPINIAISKYADRRSLFSLTTKELHSLPKNFLLYYVDRNSLINVWYRLSDSMKLEPEIRSFETCRDHHNRLGWTWHVDGPGPTKGNCQGCKEKLTPDEYYEKYWIPMHGC